MVWMESRGFGGVIGKEIVVYVYFRGYIEERVNEVLSYAGERAECVWMWENMGEVAAMKLVEQVLRSL